MTTFDKKNLPGANTFFLVLARALAARPARLCLPALLLCLLGAQTAHAQLTIRTVTWDIIGLDSNNPSIGPNTFQVGSRVCNTSGAALNNVVGNFVWDSTNFYVELSGSATNRARTLAAGACIDFYYPVTVTRLSAAYNTTRRYHMTASADGVAAVSTPTPRELYVEKLISQGRNTVTSITGPSSVTVGQTYQYTLVASTATQGYEQLEAFLDLPNVVFQVVSIQTSYSAPAGATNDKFYADACGWNNVPGTANYRNCVGPVNWPGGKVGGNLTSVYTVKILSGGTTTPGALILDFSGSSFHYNNDYGPTGPAITAADPALTLSKLSSVASVTASSATVTYTLRATNFGTGPVTLNDFVDTPPTSPATPAYVSGSSKFNGAAIANPSSSAGKLTWSGLFVVPAGASRDLTYQMTIPNKPGTYANSAVAMLEYSQIDTTQALADNAPASAAVTRPPPDVTLAKSVSPTGTVLAGSDLTYTIAFTNGGGSPASSFVLLDPVPADTDFKVGSASAALGTTGLTVALSYSNDGGTTWTYTPVSAAGGAPAGYDRNVTHVRWTFTGSLAQDSPNNAGSVAFTTRIR
ncbi:MAG TPA: hypothetical protein VF659_22380 [Pyrinomonadaceae bacterium]|jgi:uncharacterized repeat protein (TIGR01451 family)